MYYIYLTTNLINNKKYIGKHKGELNDNYLGSGTLLKEAISKYGKENFKKEILHISASEEENCLKEQEFIEKFNATESKEFYNIAKGGAGGDIFNLLPEEHKNRLRQLHSQRAKGKNNPMFGKHHSEETKEKLRKIDRSYTQTIEYKENMSKAVQGEKNGMYGKHHTEESKQKMSDAKKGKKLGKENGNAKGISAYSDEDMTVLVKHFDTIQEALIFVKTKPNDYSGISRRMKEGKSYKGYYWKKDV